MPRWATIADVHLIFVDDARQTPSRPGIRGNLVAAGAIAVPADKARQVEKAIAATCRDVGFPAGQEFKWSPRRGSWMFEMLHGDERARFFSGVIDRLGDANAFAVVVMEDAGRSRATSTAPSAERDVVVLLLERVANRLKDLRETGLLIADRPGGDRREEDRFVADCLTTLEEGTNYVSHEEIAFVITTDSRFVRLLQAADLATSCMTAYVAGEAVHSPPIVQRLLPLYPVAYDRRAGYSIKIHPDYNFANLHHWLFGETHFVGYQMGYPMPLKGRDYAEGPDRP